MSMSNRTWRPRRRIFLVAAIAAVTPIVWMTAFSGSLPRKSADFEFVVRLSLASTLSWSMVAGWLTASRRSLMSALGIGALSPVLALTLLTFVGLQLLPIEFLVSTPSVTSWLGVFGLQAVFIDPLMFVPVGLAMGVCAWAIATPRRTPRELPLSVT